MDDLRSGRDKIVGTIGLESCTEAGIRGRHANDARGVVQCTAGDRRGNETRARETGLRLQFERKDDRSIGRGHREVRCDDCVDGLIEQGTDEAHIVEEIGHIILADLCRSEIEDKGGE